jgi:hypothetical protein
VPTPLTRLARHPCSEPPAVADSQGIAPNPKTVAEHADLVEHLYETGGPPLSVECPAGTTGQQRVWLLEHHQAIQDEFRRRGWSTCRRRSTASRASSGSSSASRPTMTRDRAIGFSRGLADRPPLG